MMDIRFDFSEYQARLQPLPWLPFEWDSISDLAIGLSNSDGPLAKCVRRVRVYLISEWTAWEIIIADHNNRPGYQAGLRSLLEMLEANQSLEYLDIVVPFGHFIYLDDFREHHRKPINRSLKLDSDIKVAFLSVFPAREKLAETSMKRTRRFTRSSRAVCPLPQLDQHVLSKIFAFAAPPVLRRVYLRDSPRSNWEEPDPMPI
jgi:PIN domain nuclease of toxin-antitoxin system